ncbi:MAG: ABC transporter [Betaproteobacteria bacterium SG8_41]|nr:MAG: ABC transporter [Betaproteobacteria bacterium SG8_41]
MPFPRRRHLQLFVHHGLFVVLLIALVTLLAYLAHEHRIERDLTQSGRNTLSTATLDVLRQLDAPVSVTAYAMANDTRGENVHRRIENFLRPYQRVMPDLSLTLVDPRENPKAAAAAGVRAPVELVVEYKQRVEHLTEFTERAFVNLLMRLVRGTERLVLWLDGHGERSLAGAANHDLGDFGRQLRTKGFRINSVNLAVAQEMPANAALLLIASPQAEVTAAEVQKIRKYLSEGGNLLWLIDPEPLRGLQPVAEQLGLVLMPGVVVDPRASEFAASPAFAVGTTAGYNPHAVTATLQLNTLFPYSRQVGTIESDEWRSVPLVEVAPRGWVEMGSLEGALSFDKNRDVPGPVTIAVALQRTVNDKAQRIAVFGNAGFLSNTYLGNGGNLDLGVNLVNWLVGDDDLITIQPRASADSRLEISQLALYLIAFSFLFLLPFAFMITGLVIWWRRHKT